jgi:NAD-dependent dihydropyrimidine dehydrogenase PreA subunit
LNVEADGRAIKVDVDRCTGCGVCVAVCPWDAIHLATSQTGSYAEVDHHVCRECGACAEACPEEAITLAVESTVKGELVPIERELALVPPMPRAVYPVRVPGKALTWLEAMLTFVGREIVPRGAASLLDAWDRRASRKAAAPDVLESALPLRRSAADPSGRARHRQRRRRGRGGH